MYNYTDDREKDRGEPTCILARMEARIHIIGMPAVFKEQMAFEILSNETTASNYTCDAGDKEQLILDWYPDSEMIFDFRRGNVRNFDREF